MVPGVDLADIPRELPETVKAREREVLVLAGWAIDDVWVHLHEEHRDISVSSFIFPSLQRRIDRVHLSSELLSFVRSVYTVCISSDHLAVVVQTPPEEPGLPPRYRFPVDMLSCDEGIQALLAVLEGMQRSDLHVEQWREATHRAMRSVGERWRQWRPQVGRTHLDVLVRRVRSIA